MHTPDFSQPITLWSPSQKKRQDVYFQPGLTWLNGVTQGVAMLFLENYADSGDINRQDFREFTKGLTRWAYVACGGDAGAVVSEENLRQAYAHFQEATMAYGHLQAFVSAHFQFHLQLCGEQMEGTVFPMFPELWMKVGNSASTSFRPTSRKLDTSDLEALRAFFGEMGVRFGQEAQASTLEAEYITEFVFTGYARLLIRSALQAAADALEQANASASDLDDCLDGLDNAVYANISGMASRFLMHGLNLPADLFGPGDPTADEGLFASSGQQFPFAQAKDGNAYSISLLQPTTPATWLTLGSTGSQLDYVVQDEEDVTSPGFEWVSLAKSMQAVSAADLLSLPSPAMEAMPTHSHQHLHFALRSRSTLERADGGTSHLVPLSSSLVDHLRSRMPNPQLNLVVWSEGKPDQATDIPNDSFTWGALAELDIQKIPDTETDGFLAGVYQLKGASDAVRELLEAVVVFLSQTHDAQPVALSLLAKVQEGQFVEPALLHHRIVLLRSNLGGEQALAPATTFAAAFSQDADFLQMLWESVLIGGTGHYLHLPDADAATEQLLFGSGTEGKLQLLISFTDPADPIHDFNNVAVFEAELDVERDLVLARSEETVPVPALPPGYLGLLLTGRASEADAVALPVAALRKAATLRSKPLASAPILVSLNPHDEVTLHRYSSDGHWILVQHGGMPGWIKLDQGSGNVFEGNVPASLPQGVLELSVLYQLLGLRVAADTRFRASEAGLPIGPTEEMGSDGQPTSNWLYERLVPTYTLVNSSPGTAEPGLPDPAANPYLGVGPSSGSEASRFTVESWWQDVYGNRFSQGKAAAQFAVQYTDELLGLNQWPSLTERYLFQNDAAGKRWLNVSLAFDPSPYQLESHQGSADPALSLDSRVRGDLELIKKAYYQLSQPDVQVRVGTSLDGTFVGQDPSRLQLLALAGSIHQYLMTRLSGQSPAAPAPLMVTMDASGLQLPREFVMDVRVTLDVSRALALVDDRLKQGGHLLPEYAQVAKASAQLSPQFESLSIQSAAGQTLQTLAASASTSFGFAVTGADLLKANSARQGLFVSGVSLDPAQLVLDTSLLEIPLSEWEAFVATSPTPWVVSPNDSPDSLSNVISLDMEQALGRSVPFGVSDLAALLAQVAHLLVPGMRYDASGLSLRPFAAKFQAAFPGLYLAVSPSLQGAGTSNGSSPLFAVQMGAQGITFDIQEQQPIYYSLPPLANALLSGEVQSADIAAWMASITDDADLAAVTFSPNRSSTTLQSLDLNVLAREALVSLESLLEPSSLANAHLLTPQLVRDLLLQKIRLAQTLSSSIQPVLARDLVPGYKTTHSFAEAAKALEAALLRHLVNGYDTETVAQLKVQVRVGSGLAGSLNFPSGLEPRVQGKARVLRARVGEDPSSREEIAPSKLNFTLSSGKIRLRNQNTDSSFTYLFDTRSPELFSNVELDMEFVPAQIEFNLSAIEGIPNFLASDWLSFVLPEGIRQGMGTSQVPIPLRSYPTPPSLILHRAEPDPTSLELIADVRQWKYAFVYEHLDVSQDSIDCIVQLNVADNASLPVGGGSAARPIALMQSLTDLQAGVQVLRPHLLSLQDAALPSQPDKARKAHLALIAYRALISTVADAWSGLSSAPTQYQAGEADLHFEISEEATAQADERQALVRKLRELPSKIGGPALLPSLELPGYKQKAAPVDRPGERVFLYEVDEEDQTTFGDSSVPDRLFSIENLDVIEHQNAWASVWLSRNKHLITELAGPVATNPAFIFQTPAVRFSSLVTPFITNDEPWNLATLGSPDGSAQTRTLVQHLQTLVQTLFPTFPGARYEVRLACSYSFSVVPGQGLNPSLVTSLPVSLSIRVGPDNLNAGYASALANEINTWLQANQPSRENASLSFSFDLFSKLDPESNTSLPMLRVTQLDLRFENISEG